MITPRSIAPTHHPSTSTLLSPILPTRPRIDPSSRFGYTSLVVIDDRGIDLPTLARLLMLLACLHSLLPMGLCLCAPTSSCCVPEEPSAEAIPSHPSQLDSHSRTCSHGHHSDRHDHSADQTAVPTERTFVPGNPRPPTESPAEPHAPGCPCAVDGDSDRWTERVVSVVRPVEGDSYSLPIVVVDDRSPDRTRTTIAVRFAAPPLYRTHCSLTI